MSDQQQLTDEQKNAICKQIAETFAKPIRCPILHYPEDYGLEYEDVFFPSLDGVPLEGWFFPCKGSNLLVICNHVLWMNRSGFPGDIEPWRSIGAAGGNTFRINFMPDYKHLHDAGYNVLCYDLRNHGHSGAANGGITGNGWYESRDVAASIKYARSRPDTKNMKIGLYSRCVGANSTFIAAARYPEYFKDIVCQVSPQPVSMEAFYKAVTKLLGMPEKYDEINRATQLINSFTADNMSPIPYAKAVTWPTLIAQVHDDCMTDPSDIQAIFDNISCKDKKLHWIYGTTRRFDGYNYFPENPKLLIEWFDTHMK
ncbi:alpha/beta-hydrolase [Martensiomyces pterosporus]|nr:alpha/beta-hydrolase [Martensiomyces pterosporus]